MIRKNAVESVQAERNILISVRNPFVVITYIFPVAFDVDDVFFVFSELNPAF